MPNDSDYEDDDARAEKIINSEPIFEQKYRRDHGTSKEGDPQPTFLWWLDQALSQIRPFDLFGATTRPLTNEDAKNYLQSDEFLKTFGWIQSCLDKAHDLNGEIRQKSDEILSIAKKIFNDADIFKNWKGDINRRKKWWIQQRLGEEGHTPFNCPRDKWPVTDKNGAPLPQLPNAIAALRWYLEDEGITIKYDHWRNGISIDNPTKSKFPREGKEFIIKNWINKICDKFHILFTIEHMKYASGQLAAFHQFHSLLQYFSDLKWDGKDRLPLLVKDIMKLEGTGLQMSVITKQLIASVRRVKLPGTKYDLCPCLIAVEGLNKSTLLMVLYGRRNLLAEDILDLTAKEQSEKMRNGIWGVEFADTLGDKKTNAGKIKAFIVRQDDVGRDAYGHVEDVEHIGRTAVFWHTGNNSYLLTSEDGNRRFIPMLVLAMMDINLLRKERDQIWAQIVELERIGREAYEAEMRANNIPITPGDEVYPDIMLEKEYWADARQLQQQSMQKTGYEDSLSGVIYWPDVMWESKEEYRSISIFSSTIKEQLGIPDYKWNSEAQKISRVMKGKVELRKDECEGLFADVFWSKADNLKKAGNNAPFNGYRIEFSTASGFSASSGLICDVGLRAYDILRRKKEKFDKEMGLM